MADFLTYLAWNAIEASVLAVAVALLLKVVRLRAAVRHALWLLVVAKLLMPPVGSAPAALSCSLRSALNWTWAQLGEPHQLVPAGRPERGPRREVTSNEGPRAGTSHEDSVPVTDASDAREIVVVAVGEQLLPPVGQTPQGEDSLGGSFEARSADALTRPDAARGSRSQDWALKQPRETEHLDVPGLQEMPGGVRVFEPASLATVSSGGMSPAPLTSRLATPAATAEGTLSPRIVLPLALFLLWLCGASAYVLWGTASVVAFRRRLGALGTPPGEASEACRELASRLGLRRAPRFGVLKADVTPLLWFLGAPVIVVSEELCARRHRSALWSVLAHELAHLKRRDHWLLWLEFAAGMVFWWLPTFWWVRRELRDAADESADALAVSVLGSRRRYAEALLATLELLNRTPVSLPPVAHAVGRGTEVKDCLMRRLTMIMHDPIHRQLSWPARTALLFLSLLVLPVASDEVAGQSRPGGQDTVDELSVAPDILAEDPVAPPQDVEALLADEPDLLPPVVKAEPGVEERLEALERMVEKVLLEIAELRRGTDDRRAARPAPPPPQRPPAAKIDPLRSVPLRDPAEVGLFEDVQTKLLESKVAELQSRIAKQDQEIARLQEENLRLQDQLALFRGQKAPAGKRIAARVDAIDKENELVVLSVGTDQKVEVGDEFTIHRGVEFVGKVKVVKVYPDLSGARVLFTKKWEQIRKADSAFCAIPEAPTNEFLADPFGNLFRRRTGIPGEPLRPATAATPPSVATSDLMGFVSTVREAFGQDGVVVQFSRMDTRKGTVTLVIRSKGWKSMSDGFGQLAETKAPAVASELKINQSADANEATVSFAYRQDAEFSVPQAIETLNRIAEILEPAKTQYSIRTHTREHSGDRRSVAISVVLQGASEASLFDLFSSLAKAAGPRYVTEVSVRARQKAGGKPYIELDGRLSNGAAPAGMTSERGIFPRSSR